MGLSIYAYSNIKASDLKISDGGDFICNDGIIHNNAFSAHILKGFESHAEDLSNGVIYTADSRERYPTMRCSTYNDWRNELARFCGYKPADDITQENRKHLYSAWRASEGPFWHLLNFTDNEGCIGPAVCSITYKEFVKHHDKAKNFESYPKFYQHYETIMEAFEQASQNGAIEFS